MAGQGPQNQQQAPEDPMSAIGNQVGLFLNLASAATGVEPAGNSVLNYADEAQRQAQTQFNKNQKDQQDAQDLASQQAQDAKFIQSNAARIATVPDKYKAPAQALVDNGNAKGLGQYLDFVEGRMDQDRRINEAYARDNRNQENSDLRNTAAAIHGSIKDLQPAVGKAEALQDALQSFPREANGTIDFAKFAAAHPNLVPKDNPQDPNYLALQQQVNKDISAAAPMYPWAQDLQRRGLPVEYLGDLAKDKTKVDSKQAFSDFAPKTIGPDLYNQYQGQQNNLKAIQFIRSNLNSKDPKVQSKVQQARKALDASMNQD